jgi:superfamily I DNA/RNA helicase
VYIDEVQDSTEVEVILFFLAAGMNYDRLYLAGDPAQAIVEGVDFRFEEIRSLVHTLSKNTKRVEKTVGHLLYVGY